MPKPPPEKFLRDALRARYAKIEPSDKEIQFWRGDDGKLSPEATAAFDKVGDPFSAPARSKNQPKKYPKTGKR